MDVGMGALELIREGRQDELDKLRDDLTEVAGDPTPDGEWAVYWPARQDPVLERYATRTAAKAAARLCFIELASVVLGEPETPFSVRRWDGKGWTPVDSG